MSLCCGPLLECHVSIEAEERTSYLFFLLGYGLFLLQKLPLRVPSNTNYFFRVQYNLECSVTAELLLIVLVKSIHSVETLRSRTNGRRISAFWSRRLCKFDETNPLIKK